MPINPELLEIVTEEIADLSGADQLVDMLTAVQKKLGYVPPATVPALADKAEVSRPEVYKAIELSSAFSLTPAGDHKLFVCNAENCCMYGGSDLLQFAEEHLGIKAFETTTDNKIRLETFQCLGNCSMAPNVMLNGRVHGMMDNQQLEKLLQNL